MSIRYDKAVEEYPFSIYNPFLLRNNWFEQFYDIIPPAKFFSDFSTSFSENDFKNLINEDIDNNTTGFELPNLLNSKINFKNRVKKSITNNTKTDYPMLPHLPSISPPNQDIIDSLLPTIRHENKQPFWPPLSTTRLLDEKKNPPPKKPKKTKKSPPDSDPNPEDLTQRQDYPFILPSEAVPFDDQAKLWNPATQPLPPNPNNYKYFTVRRIKVWLPQQFRDDMMSRLDYSVVENVASCFSDWFPVELIADQDLEHQKWAKSQNYTYTEPNHIPGSSRESSSVLETEFLARGFVKMDKIDKDVLANYYGYPSYDSMPYHPRVPLSATNSTVKWVHRCITPWQIDNTITALHNPKYYLDFDREDRATWWMSLEDSRIAYDRCGRLKIIYGSYNDMTPIFPNWGVKIVDARMMDDRLQFSLLDLCDEKKYIYPQPLHTLDGAPDGHVDHWEKNYSELIQGIGKDDLYQNALFLKQIVNYADSYHPNSNTLIFSKEKYDFFKNFRINMYLESLRDSEWVDMVNSIDGLRYNLSEYIRDDGHGDDGDDDDDDGKNSGKNKKPKKEPKYPPARNVKLFHNVQSKHCINISEPHEPPETNVVEYEAFPKVIEQYWHQKWVNDRNCGSIKSLLSELKKKANYYFSQSNVYLRSAHPFKMANSTMHLTQTHNDSLKQCLLDFAIENPKEKFNARLFGDRFHLAGQWYLLRLSEDDYDKHPTFIPKNKRSEWVYWGILHDRSKYNKDEPFSDSNRNTRLYRAVAVMFDAVSFETISVFPLFLSTPHKCRKGPAQCVTGGVATGCERNCDFIYVHSIFAAQTPLSFTIVEDEERLKTGPQYHREGYLPGIVARSPARQFEHGYDYFVPHDQSDLRYEYNNRNILGKSSASFGELSLGDESVVIDDDGSVEHEIDFSRSDKHNQRNQQNQQNEKNDDSNEKIPTPPRLHSLHTVLPTWYTLDTQFFAILNIDDRLPHYQEIDLRALWHHRHICSDESRHRTGFKHWESRDWKNEDPVDLKFTWQQRPQKMFPWIPDSIFGGYRMLEFYSWDFHWEVLWKVKVMWGVFVGIFVAFFVLHKSKENWDYANRTDMYDQVAIEDPYSD
jgi:hypothetical protein